MFILFSIILVIAIVVSVSLYGKFKWDGAATIAGFSSFFLIGSMIAVGILWAKVANGYVIDAKIAMYEEENSRIEESIDTLVSNYLEYEQRTFAEFKPDGQKDVVILMSLFPELKADTLVQAQMGVYIENNQHIKELREEKINLLKLRWLLYFGK